ncbi:MAE_28990/MAE_18760 family HEPN-like nuclease [Paenibacillus polymyxa]|uniref:MAE_28990/MAE_18760 family HEPN-like nuclease n=1 Tax=Paenibacillus polymyxa TaxID=1406 RepID=UPI003D2B80E0
MIEVKNNFQRRDNEIDQYLNFIDIMLEGNVSIQSNQGEAIRINNYVSSTLKASVFLMFYNIIESTVSRSIELIHNTITAEELTYSEINHQIKKLWLDYYLSNHQSGQISKLALKLISGVFSNEKVNIEFREYINKKTIFSGNLDAMKIKDISSNYGFKITKNKLGKQLLTVKNLRNKLSHGDISFSECGRNYVVNDLKKIKKDVSRFLEHFLDQVEIYITSKKYKIITSNDMAN